MGQAQNWIEVQKFEAHKLRKALTLEKIVPRLLKVDEQRAHDVELCGTYVYVCECASCRARHYAGHMRCRVRWCIDCAHQRAMKYVAKVLERMMPYLSDGYVPHMLTMTIRDGDSLQERIDFLRASWRRFTNGSARRREQFKARMKGGFRSIEVKIGKGSGKWHPHMHMIFITPPGEFQRDWEWVMPTWKDVTAGDGSVEVHKIKEGPAGILKAVCEVVKYFVAPDKETLEIDDERFSEMYWTLKGLRSVNTWGLLRGVDLEAEQEDTDLDIKKLADFVCQLCGCEKYEIQSVLASELGNALLLDL